MRLGCSCKWSLKHHSYEQLNYCDSIAEETLVTQLLMWTRSCQLWIHSEPAIHLSMYKIWQPVASRGDSDRSFEQVVNRIWQDFNVLSPFTKRWSQVVFNYCFDSICFYTISVLPLRAAWNVSIFIILPS